MSLESVTHELKHLFGTRFAFEQLARKRIQSGEPALPHLVAKNWTAHLESESIYFLRTDVENDREAVKALPAIIKASTALAAATSSMSQQNLIRFFFNPSVEALHKAGASEQDAHLWADTKFLLDDDVKTVLLAARMFANTEKAPRQAEAFAELEESQHGELFKAIPLNEVSNAKELGKYLREAEKIIDKLRHSTAA